MKIPLHIAEKLWELAKGNYISSSELKHPVVQELLAEGILDKYGRIQKKIYAKETKSLLLYLQNKYGINDLEKYIELSKKENVLRNELVEISSDSKLKQVRTFKGFLINSYLPIHATINNQPIEFNFIDGVFQFVFDFENFVPEPQITVVGVENAENFRLVEKQKHLFEGLIPLFVSRYPQNQSKDMIKWLKSIPNNYLHFGDFDFAGIGIYVNEFKKHLGGKASFLVPENIDKLISEFGNRKRYDDQKINFAQEAITEEKLLKLIATIHKYSKGLDQEILIGDSSQK